MESITITGRLGSDAQVKHSDKTGNDFITFSVASNKRLNGENLTSWWDVMVSNTKRFEKMAQYLKKGTGVIVVGEPHVSTFEGRDGQTRVRLSVYADRVDFMSDGSQQKNTESDTKPITSAEKPSAPKPKKVEVEPEDIPMMRKSDTEVNDDDLPF